MHNTNDPMCKQEFYESVKAASKAAVGLEEHHREVIAAKGMENTPTLRTIASETKKSLLHRVDVRCCCC